MTTVNVVNPVKANFEFLLKKDKEILFNKVGFAVTLVCNGLVDIGQIIDHIDARNDANGIAQIDSQCDGFSQIKGFVKDFTKKLVELEFLPKSHLDIGECKPAQFTSYGKFLLAGGTKDAFIKKLSAMNGDYERAATWNTLLNSFPTLAGFEGAEGQPPVLPAQIQALAENLERDHAEALNLNAILKANDDAKFDAALAIVNARTNAIEAAKQSLIDAEALPLTGGDSPLEAPTEVLTGERLSEVLEAVNNKVLTSIELLMHDYIDASFDAVQKAKVRKMMIAFAQS
jgi:hypothetical protein